MSPYNTTEDLTGTSWRDELWLQYNPLNIVTVLKDYFALSPFYNVNCNNELAKMRNLDFSLLPTLPPGVEYVVQSAQEPHLYIIRKQFRSSPSSTTTQAFYYVHTGTIYQAPTLHSAVFSRWKRCLHHMQKTFRKMQQDLDPLTEWKRRVKERPLHQQRKEVTVKRRFSKKERENLKEGAQIIASALTNFPYPEIPALESVDEAKAEEKQGDAAKEETQTETKKQETDKGNKQKSERPKEDEPKAKRLRQE